jgi:AmiR/NasT family two-component response regulator
VSSRDVIGQAKGILMERHKLTADQAFGVLTRVSQELNRKLVDVARELSDTGAVPGANRRRD